MDSIDIKWSSENMYTFSIKGDIVKLKKISGPHFIFNYLNSIRFNTSFCNNSHFQTPDVKLSMKLS